MAIGSDVVVFWLDARCSFLGPAGVLEKGRKGTAAFKYPHCSEKRDKLDWVRVYDAIPNERRQSGSRLLELSSGKNCCGIDISTPGALTGGLRGLLYGHVSLVLPIVDGVSVPISP